MMKLLFTKATATISLMIASATAFAQANDWVLAPNTRINFSSGSASVSSISTGSGLYSCGSSSTSREYKYSSVVSDASGNGVVFLNVCGMYDLSGNYIGAYGTSNYYQNVFAVPGLCKTYYSIGWEDQWGPPHYNKLTIHVLDASNPSSITEISSTDVINDGYAHSTAIAVAPLAADGTRKIYLGDSYALKSITIGVNGSISAVSTITAMANTADARTGMEVSPDGKKITMLASGPQLYNISSNTFTSLGSFPNGGTVVGMEYVPYGSDDRVYMSYNKWDGFNTYAGLIYVSLSAPTISVDAVPGIPTPIKYGFGYTDIERGKDGKLYFAYHPGYTNHYVITGDVGTLYSLDPSSGTLAAVMNGSANVPVYSLNYNWNYVIQKQIDGESYRSYTLATPTFNLNGKTQSLFNIPSITLCDADSIKIYTSESGYYSSYRVTIQKGTVSGTTFTPVGSPVTSAYINASGPNEVINLQQLFDANLDSSYSGGLQVTFTVYNGCSSASRTQTFNLQRVAALARYYAPRYIDAFHTYTKALQKTVPINTPMPAAGGSLSAFKVNIGNTIGWLGASSASADSIKTNGAYYLKVYEVQLSYDTNVVTQHVDTNAVRMVYIDTNSITGVITSDTAPDICYYTSPLPVTTPTNVPFNQTTLVFDPTSNQHYYYDTTQTNQDGYNYFSSYYTWARTHIGLAAFSSKIFCVEFKVTTDSGCTVVNKSYFRIANNGVANGGGAKQALNTVQVHASETDVLLYPNPTLDKVKIVLLRKASSASILLLDSYGRIILKQEGVAEGNNILDLKKLPAGIYFYRLVVDGDSYNGTLIKQ